MLFRKKKQTGGLETVMHIFKPFLDAGIVEDIYMLGVANLDCRDQLMEVLEAGSMPQILELIHLNPPPSQAVDYLKLYLLRDKYLDAFVFVTLDPVEPFHDEVLLKLRQVDKAGISDPGEFRLVYPIDQ